MKRREENQEEKIEGERNGFFIKIQRTGMGTGFTTTILPPSSSSLYLSISLFLLLSIRADKDVKSVKKKKNI